MYKLIKSLFDGSIRTDMVFRVADGCWIPNDDANKDWRDYQDWVDAGNQPLPPDEG